MTPSFSAGFTSDQPCIESTLFTLKTWVVWSENRGYSPKWWRHLWSAPYDNHHDLEDLLWTTAATKLFSPSPRRVGNGEVRGKCCGFLHKCGVFKPTYIIIIRIYLDLDISRYILPGKNRSHETLHSTSPTARGIVLGNPEAQLGKWWFL